MRLARSILWPVLTLKLISRCSVCAYCSNCTSHHTNLASPLAHLTRRRAFVTFSAEQGRIPYPVPRHEVGGLTYTTVASQARGTMQAARVHNPCAHQNLCFLSQVNQSILSFSSSLGPRCLIMSRLEERSSVFPPITVGSVTTPIILGN